MDPSDALLVAATLQGDQTAYEQLIRRHFRVAYATAIALTGAPQDAEDVCQDAMVAAYNRLADCRSPERFRSWLIEIVRNRAHNHRRYVSRRTTVQLSAAREQPALDSPSDDLERTELRARLRNALSMLSAVQRVVVLLHDLEGCTHREVAVGLGISEVMSRRHLSDARRRLRGLLESQSGCRPGRKE